MSCSKRRISSKVLGVCEYVAQQTRAFYAPHWHHSWVDDETDMPLVFSFYYLIAGGDGTEFQILANSYVPRCANVLLPQGGGNASVITGIVYVADQVQSDAYTLALVLNRVSCVIVPAPFFGSWAHQHARLDLSRACRRAHLSATLPI